MEELEPKLPTEQQKASTLQTTLILLMGFSVFIVVAKLIIETVQMIIT
jgi:hypothetical protein